MEEKFTSPYSLPPRA